MKIQSYDVNMTVAALGAVLVVGVDELEAYRETQGELFVAPLSDVQKEAFLRFRKWRARGPEGTSRLYNSPMIDELEF